ncbi:Alpha/Beta hydrolase protein [Spinellus fusiger]|nr:Alpha/Beta hydrolase protein [Spinellus fusiger]
MLSFSTTLYGTVLAISMATAGFFYKQKNPQPFVHRLWFFLIGRDLDEDVLERQLVSARSSTVAPFLLLIYFFASLLLCFFVSLFLCLYLAEPPIVAENTQYVEINFHRLRIVHIIHELGSKVPLIVFIHGLGGQVAQWQYQLEYFSHTAHVLAIDLLGCGQSEVSKDWDAYTTPALVQDIKELLLHRYNHPCTVIIAHSYGCSIATYVASFMEDTVKALVLISPKHAVTEKQKKDQAKLGWIPDWAVDLLRLKDRKHGLSSQSVKRMLGSESNVELREKQLRWNVMSRTSVYKRIVCGASFPTKEDYQHISANLLLIGGSKDTVVDPEDMLTIRQHYLSLDSETFLSENSTKAHQQRVPKPYLFPEIGHMAMVVSPQLVNAMLSEFLIKACGMTTLSGAWQVLHKTKGENKWDLKNYEKWALTANITASPVGCSLFRAMKVMRQTDPNHCPSAFLAKYPDIGFIIDISNDTPPYRSSDFEDSRVHYLKLKTVSKIPPSHEDVTTFIQLASACWEKRPEAQIAVHCHYGFNRTGFFICCYMIEKMNVSVSEAIQAFAAVRSPGIRHAHFIDELYLRYSLYRS